MADFKNIRVLLVEDDQFSRMILGQLLQIMHIKHDEACDGAGALELAKANEYDLILMDISMPVMDGYVAASRIRELPGYQDKTIIALTAFISEKVQNEVRSGLFTDFNLKPVDPDELKQKIIKIARNKP
jgi:two-component system, sensor histidine kinase and response regulator